MYRVSFTGYRPEKLPFFGEDDPMCIDLKERIFKEISALADDGATEFCTGMALGVDTWCAEAVLRLKSERPGITLIALIPCPEQDSKWNSEQKRRYHNILEQCDRKLTISPKYTRDCMHKRDRALVDMCDVLVAVYDGKEGGTKYTVEYAKKQGRKTIILPVV
ncbi:MAG: DUF1273 domain-containing protein [Oscillospiraceae bacterium]|nr:DUF1273 domain-containing protein [Oscillospiraceae bacterium]